MTPERWQRVDEIFQAAVELNLAQRETFLNASCGADQELRSEVESLLSCDEEGLSIIDEPAYQVAAGLLVSEKHQLTEGQQFGHYEIAGLIGKGGMGEVYVAQDLRLKRRIALKLLPTDYTKHKDRLRRFQQEAQTASALNHPNILTIHELGEVDGRQFIATEFVEGETLRERMKTARRSLAETLDIATQVASALAAAHKAGIVHRDIKPENIMLRPDGYVKVLDFGLAKLTEDFEAVEQVRADDGLIVSSGLLLGTVKYMSPEQARGQQIDSRSDIFSFGVVLYEMVAGHAPFEAKTANDLVDTIIGAKPEPLLDVPDELRRIINQALCKNREERYQTVADLLNDLTQLKANFEVELRLQKPTANLIQKGDTARGPGWGVRTGELETVNTTPTARSQIDSTRRFKIGATLIFAVLALAAVGFAIYKSVKPRRATIRFQSTEVTRLTTSGHAWSPAISPDGKYLVFGSVQDDKVSLALKQIGTNTEAQILSITDGHGFWGAAFSPDGKYVYYSIRKDYSNRGSLYQVPALGGSATRLPVDLDGRVSVSPDGKRLAYIRYDKNRYEKALLIANADGSDERTILTQKGDAGCEYCNDVAWSPEGTSLAYADSSESGKARIMEVNISDGTVTPVASPEWIHVVFITWLPDKSGLLVVAASEHTGPTQIWNLTYPGGEARKLTNDVSNYEGISVSADGRTLITAQVDVESKIWTAPVDANNPLLSDLSQAKQVSVNRFEGRSGLAVAPDGRIVYSSKEGGQDGIWIMDANGQNRTPLAENGIHPVVSSDGRYIVFQSTKDGFIWRMDIDGGNLKQLADGAYPSISPDSKWVLYNHSQWAAWKVSIEGGAPIQITNTQSQMPRLSPDGRLLAYGYFAEKNEPKLAITPADGGQHIKTFHLPSGFSVYNWTPDGKALTFCASKDQNIWIQPIERGPSRRLTSFSPSNIIYNAWSADGRQLAFVRMTPVRDVVSISDLR